MHVFFLPDQVTDLYIVTANTQLSASVGLIILLAGTTKIDMNKYQHVRPGTSLDGSKATHAGISR